MSLALKEGRMPRRTASSAVAVQSQAGLSPAVQRRRSPRLQLLGEVHGQIVGIALPIVVRDLSDGGFSIVTSIDFPADAVHRFELALESDSRPPIQVQARVVHGRLLAGDPEALFVTGFAFTDDQPNASKADIRALVTELVRETGARKEVSPDASGSERRHDVRLDVLGELHGEFESIGIPLVVRDLSLGGCAIETHAPLEPGSTQFIRIDVYDSVSVTLQVRVVHSRRVSGSLRPPRYVSGLQFIDADRNQISEMLELLISSFKPH
jgi:hypothetical protein